MRELLNGYFADWQKRMQKDATYCSQEMTRMKILSQNWKTMTWEQLTNQADYVTSKLMQEHPEYREQYRKEDVGALDGYHGTINATAVANAACVFWALHDKAGWETFIAKVHAGRWPVEGGL